MSPGTDWVWEETTPQNLSSDESSEDFLWPELHAAHRNEFGRPTSPETAIQNFAMILASVAKLIDEEHLSKEDAIATIRGLLAPREQPEAVAAALARLESCADELQFRIELGQESLRAYGLTE